MGEQKKISQTEAIYNHLKTHGCIQSEKEESKDLIVSIYPNPTSAGEEVHFSLSDESLEGDLYLYDELGRKILRHRITTTQFAIPMLDCAGAYMVFIKSIHGDVSIRKIIVR